MAGETQPEKDRVTINDVRAAAERIKGHVAETPLIRAEKLSAITGADLWLKLENLQYTGSFKQRGALNRLMTLSDDEKARGVIAASAGNHAQGVAYNARALNISSVIVMPSTTPDIKVRQTRELGAEVILFGDAYDDASARAKEICAERGLVFVHPFDDADVIAGQGTIALEMAETVANANRAFDQVIVPIGGGGLIAGMSIALREISPSTEIIGVQMENFPSMLNELNGEMRPFGESTLAEGIAVKNAGRLTSAHIKDMVDDIVLIDERTLERALSLLIVEQKLLVEGAGAAGLATMLQDPARFTGKTVGVVLCGGNIDARLLSMILMRDLARTGRLARLRIQLVDKPGQLVRVSTIIANCGGNMVDVGHHRTYSDLPAKMTYIDVTLDTQGQEHLNRIIQTLRDSGYPVEIAAY